MNKTYFTGKINSYIYLLLLVFFYSSCSKDPVETPLPEEPDIVEPVEKTFTNPLIPRGADPWVTQKDGIYYYTYTQGSKLVLYVTKTRCAY